MCRAGLLVSLHPALCSIDCRPSSSTTVAVHGRFACDTAHYVSVQAFGRQWYSTPVSLLGRGGCCARARQMPGIDVQRTVEPRSCRSLIRSRCLSLATETGTHSATVQSSAAMVGVSWTAEGYFLGPAHRFRARVSCPQGHRPHN